MILLHYHCQNYEEAVECAWRKAKSGEVVILSQQVQVLTCLRTLKKEEKRSNI